MIISKVIRDNRRHITRADYNDTKPILGSENVAFPKVGSLQSRALRRLFPAGLMLTHRGFDFASQSYRLGGYIDKLRDKGWTIVDHDETALTKDIIQRKATFTRYELFAAFMPELQERINAFCKAVDELEAPSDGQGGVMTNKIKTALHGNAKAANTTAKPFYRNYAARKARIYPADCVAFDGKGIT